MGVKACARYDCENIMCDTYINGAGYICNECKEEFKNFIRVNNYDISNKYELLNYFYEFMHTFKGDFKIYFDKTINEFFEIYTDD